MGKNVPESYVLQPGEYLCRIGDSSYTRRVSDHGIQLTYAHGPSCRGCIRVREAAFDAIAGTIRSRDEDEL